MKNLLLLPLLFLAMCSLYKAELTQEEKYRNIIKKNKIQYVKTYSISYENGVPDETQKTLDEIKTYDEKGFLIREEKLGEKEWATSSTYEYFDNGNNSKRTVYDYEGKEKYHNEYTYENKKLKESKVFTPEGVIEHISSYSYDENGNQTLTKKTDSKGTPLGETVSTYDEKGRVIEYIWKDSALDIYLKTKTKYISDIEKHEEDYNINGKIVERRVIITNSEGNTVRDISYKTEDNDYEYSRGERTESNYKYNELGLSTGYYCKIENEKSVVPLVEFEIMIEYEKHKQQ